MSALIQIQVKEPYVALSRSGLKLRYGQPLEVQAGDPRVVFWLEGGYAEIIEEQPKEKKHTQNRQKGKEL